MKTIFQIWILLAAAAILIASEGEIRETEESLAVPVGNLTIDQACQIALKNNPQVQQAAESIQAAKEVLTQANAAWWPTVWRMDPI